MKFPSPGFGVSHAMPFTSEARVPVVRLASIRRALRTLAALMICGFVVSNSEHLRLWGLAKPKCPEFPGLSSETVPDGAILRVQAPGSRPAVICVDCQGEKERARPWVMATLKLQSPGGAFPRQHWTGEPSGGCACLRPRDRTLGPLLPAFPYVCILLLWDCPISLNAAPAAPVPC